MKKRLSKDVNNFITSKDVSGHILSDARNRTLQTRSVRNKII